MNEHLQLRVFISSVQKELASERLAVQILLTTDPFLQRHSRPILFEFEPQPLRPDSQAYLKLLEKCQLFVLILGRTYGNLFNNLSATHYEYRKAMELQLPTLVCVMGDGRTQREEALRDLLDEVKKDGHTYNRFSTNEELQNIVRDRLIKHIKDCYHIEPTRDEESIGKGAIASASSFERQRLAEWALDVTVKERRKQLAVAAAGDVRKTMPVNEQIRELRNRGYVWQEDAENVKLTAAGLLLIGEDPSACFAHCRVQLDAFSSNFKDAHANDHANATGDIATLVEKVVAFIDRNTRHPLRVSGLRRIEVTEYPEEAIREAIVNALAHRDYEDATRHVVVEVFKDRIVFSSPGGPPGNTRIASISRGDAKSRSRNPLIAQGLRFMGFMEERGTGILRMKNSMLAHGLDEPTLAMEDDYFVVTLPGPGENLDRIHLPAAHQNNYLPTQISDRQQKILEHVLLSGSVTASWCVENLKVSRNTAFLDIDELLELKYLRRIGVGRGTKYGPGEAIQ